MSIDQVEDGVLAANDAFYSILESRDVANLADFIATSDDVSIVHPGRPPIDGHLAAIDSWRLIFSDFAILQFFIRDARVIACDENVAIVRCVEELYGATLRDKSPRIGLILATNAFVKHAGRWRLLSHHASQTPPVGDTHAPD